ARLRELNRYLVHINKGTRREVAKPPLVVATGHGHLLEVIGRGGCYQCGLVCNRNEYRYSNGREVNRKCHAQEYYLPWTYSQEDEPVDTFCDAPTIANSYSLCVIELRNIINWLYDCHKLGYITEQETGLPLSRIGTRDFLEKLCHVIAYREGFGDILAEGLVRMGDRVSAEARARFSPTIRVVGDTNKNASRTYIANALLKAMEPRENKPLTHEMFRSQSVWHIHQTQPDQSPVSSEVFHAIARTFWGSEEAGDLSSYEGKALAVKKIQNRQYVKESLGLCDFAVPMMFSYNTPDKVGDPELMFKMFSAVTGIGGEQLERCAERIFTFQRAILVREGRRVPEADFPPDYDFTEPLGNNYFSKQVIVPGLGDEVVDLTGKMLDRDKYTGMLKEYYRLRGWDEETGLPEAETLVALGLDELVSGFRM
ncbi:aldehyde ferredoxin oxidoreductase C-terminal domain-containing protein, partial [Chloroflexota bacterium]